MDSPTETPTKKELGLWTSTALVVGNMIGAGIFLLPASLAVYGGIGIFGWLLTSLGALLLVLMFSRLSRMVPRAGGPYVYTRQAFGDFVGFIVAWGYWISILSGNAAIAVALAGYLGVSGRRSQGVQCGPRRLRCSTSGCSPGSMPEAKLN